MATPVRDKALSFIIIHIYIHHLNLRVFLSRKNLNPEKLFPRNSVNISFRGTIKPLTQEI